jgi:hypothetical protein
VYGCSPEEAGLFRAGISQGVIAKAIATRTTILSVSALDDARFRDRSSVRLNQIQAVLCAPILAGSYYGVIYLQDREVPGPFTEEDRVRAESFAHHIGAFAERLLLRRRLSDTSDPTLVHRQQLHADDVVGGGEAMARVFRDVILAAPIDVGVLMTGPTGTGKTMIARLLHRNGPRADGPFVELNCAAIPEQLLESELFGALPGAHSTATKRIEGKVAAAERGTLFLDEVGELGSGVQAKLLQLLQDKEYYPLGGTKVDAGQRPSDRRHQRRPQGRRRPQDLPRGPLLPPQRPVDPHARAVRADRGHPRAGPADLRPRVRAVRLPPLMPRPGPSTPHRPRSGPATCASCSTPSRPPSSAPAARAPASSSRATCSPAPGRPTTSACPIRRRRAGSRPSWSGARSRRPTGTSARRRAGWTSPARTCTSSCRTWGSGPS